MVPLTADESDAMGVTEAARRNAAILRYTPVVVVNRDRMRLWAQQGDTPILDLDGEEILGKYATDSGNLVKAGESVMAGLAELWIEDLRQHWRHGPGEVPGEGSLRAANVFVDLDEGVAATP